MTSSEKFICKRCNGSGILQSDGPNYVKDCPFCDGEGSLDWIEYILGKRKKIKPLTFDANGINFDDSFLELRETFLSEIAKKMAYEIDKMILEKLVEDAEFMDENDGKFICKKCRGSGLQKDGQCENCKGFGHLDWIDNITGKSKRKKKSNISKLFSNRSGRVRIR